MRRLTIIIMACLAAMTLAYFIPGRLGVLGAIAFALLFAATFLLGILQLAASRRLRR